VDAKVNERQEKRASEFDIIFGGNQKSSVVHYGPKLFIFFPISLQL
jgi:hypothetical protein